MSLLTTLAVLTYNHAPETAARASTTAHSFLASIALNRSKGGDDLIGGSTAQSYADYTLRPLLRYSGNARRDSCEHDFRPYALEHGASLAAGDILVFRAFDSIGNCFGDLQRAADLARELGVALLIDTAAFPVLEIMLESNGAHWSFEQAVYDSAVSRAGALIVKLDRAATLVLSSSRQSLARLRGFFSDRPASRVWGFSELRDAVLAAPSVRVRAPRKLLSAGCWLRSLFRLTPFAHNRVRAALAAGGVASGAFTAWHIRTTAGEWMGAWDRSVHTYVVESPAAEICEAYESMQREMDAAAPGRAPSAVILATDSLAVKCACVGAVFTADSPLPRRLFTMDYGLAETEFHTSKRVSYNTGIASFTDLVLVLNADTIIYSGSSFSGLAVTALDMACTHLRTIGATHFQRCTRRTPLILSSELLLPAVDGPVRALLQSQRDSFCPKTEAKPHLHLRTFMSSPAVSSFPVELSTSAPCAEPLWCNHTVLLQRRIYEWQNPPDEACASAKFLVYDPPHYGIGSTVHHAAVALATAICTGRILFLPRHRGTHEMWRPPGCEASGLLCWFQPVTSCPNIDESVMEHYPIGNASTFASLTGEGIVRLDFNSVPSGPCDYCSSRRQFPLMNGIRETEAFFGSEAPLLAQLVRYLLRPLPSFSQAVTAFAVEHAQHWAAIPRPYASVHVRYGDKWKEEPREPLSKYMDALRATRPDIKSVFLSTESEWIIGELRQQYPGIAFFHFSYQRIEESHAVGEQRRTEFVASFANLFVSVQADAFVGTLTSNWCRLIHELERSRGDAGVDYMSVDRGSAYTQCF